MTTQNWRKSYAKNKKSWAGKADLISSFVFDGPISKFKYCRSILFWTKLFFSYVQKVIDETEQKSPGSAPVGGAVGGTVAVRNPVTMAGTLPQSQVDILQMLSKAQKEYDTVGNTNC